MSATQKQTSQNQAAGTNINIPSQPKLSLHNFDIAKAVQQQRLKLNMSELLGCDYIFVNPHNAQELFSPARIALSIQELVDILEVKPQQVVIVLIDDSVDPRFIRQDFTWSKGRIEQVNASAVTIPDQIEFLKMMLDCSTPY
jgi:hypothetical protein